MHHPRATNTLPQISVFALLLGLGVGACTSPPPAAMPEPPAEPPATTATPVTKEEPKVPATPETTAVDPITAAVNAADRSDADRALDAGRHPGELLKFSGLQPGERVLEIAAGAGYTTELIARVVGEKGQVYGENNRFVLEKFAEVPWTERLKKPVMKNVVRVNAELETPVPEGVSNLDAVVNVLFYHDTIWMKTDRKKMNQAIFSALRPGGRYIIVDHSSKAGEGVKNVQTLHRIEEEFVVQELLAAGFVLESRGDFLRNPEDKRDWNASPIAAAEKRGTSDRFVLKFVKPDPKAGSAEAAGALTTCGEPRSTMCTRDYRPVCADVDTGIRCITAPCPSSEQKTFGNACSACADPKVIGHRPGECKPTAKADPGKKK